MSEEKQEAFAAIHGALCFLKGHVEQELPKDQIVSRIEEIIDDVAYTRNLCLPTEPNDIVKELYQAKCKEWLSDKGEA